MTIHEGVPGLPDILLPHLHDDTLPPSWRHNADTPAEHPLPAVR